MQSAADILQHEFFPRRRPKWPRNIRRQLLLVAVPGRHDPTDSYCRDFVVLDAEAEWL